ncbi:SAM-dependent methyltransferase [bacterium]|nr:SAM-dependent methyltransferase [bacterium]
MSDADYPPYWPASAPSQPIRTDLWIEAALYDPKRGYYRNDRREPGADGDFHTPVHLGGVLGRVLALSLAHSPGVIEVGGGNGKLAKAILTHQPQLLYRVVDYSRPPPGAPWIQESPESPISPLRGGTLLGVELLDALPIRRFRKSECIEEEYWVFDSSWEPQWLPTDEEGSSLFHSVPPGEGILEIRPSLESLLTTWTRCVPQGRILFVDYGAPTGWRDSLRGFRGHQQVPPFSKPGYTDWTATVSWKRIQSLLEKGGWTTEVQTLTLWLLDQVEPLWEELSFSPQEQLAFKELISPLGLGETFQVLTARPVNLSMGSN